MSAVPFLRSMDKEDLAFEAATPAVFSRALSFLKSDEEARQAAKAAMEEIARKRRENRNQRVLLRAKLIQVLNRESEQNFEPIKKASL